MSAATGPAGRAAAPAGNGGGTASLALRLPTMQAIVQDSRTEYGVAGDQCWAVCSSDLMSAETGPAGWAAAPAGNGGGTASLALRLPTMQAIVQDSCGVADVWRAGYRSEEHTSELQSL